MLAVRVRFDRPLRKVRHDSPKPLSVIETTKIPVPVPVQAPPPPSRSVSETVTPPPEGPEEAPARDEANEAAWQAKLDAMEANHRAEYDALQEVLKQVRKSVEDGVRGRKLQMNELQQAAVEIATTVAARLMHREVSAGTFPIEQMVREMAGEMDENSPLTVYLNSEDLASLSERIRVADILPDRDQAVRIAEDANLPRGSCRLETPDAMLLGELGGQLQSIRDELLRSLGHAAGT